MFFNSFFFLRPHKPKIIFGKTTRVDSDQIESVNFIDFVQGEENVIIQLTQFYLATSYKMYLVSSKTKYGNFGLYTRYLICIWYISLPECRDDESSSGHFGLDM